VSFPEAQHEIGQSLGSLRTVTSSYASYGPQVPGTVWESAYDLWLNGDFSQGGHEVMVWTDNHGQYPSGSEVSGNVIINGVSYQLWVQRGGDYETTLVQNANSDSGSVNILGVLRWLSANGYEASDPTLSQVDYGFEICKTNGQPANFGVTSYSLDAS
jgi:zinc protease